MFLIRPDLPEPDSCRTSRIFDLQCRCNSSSSFLMSCTLCGRGRMRQVRDERPSPTRNVDAVSCLGRANHRHARFRAFVPVFARRGLFPRCCGRFSLFRRDSLSRFGDASFSRIDHCFNRSWQFRQGRFWIAMFSMVQRQVACGFFFLPPLSVCIFSTPVLEIFRNRFSCHGRSLAIWSELSNWPRSILDRSLRS